MYLLVFQILIQGLHPGPFALSGCLALDQLRIAVLVLQRIVFIWLCWGSLLLPSCCSLEDASH